VVPVGLVGGTGLVVDVVDVLVGLVGVVVAVVVVVVVVVVGVVVVEVLVVVVLVVLVLLVVLLVVRELVLGEVRLRRCVLLEGRRVGVTTALLGSGDPLVARVDGPSALDSVSGVSGSFWVRAADCRGALPMVSPGSRLLVAASAGPATTTAAAMPPTTGRRRYSGRGARCRPM
jgi:hypothetical protein